MRNKLALIIGLYFIANVAFSENNVVNTKTKNTEIHNSEINTTHSSTAIDWDLTDAEWNRYLKLMNGPSGRYYERLSPPEVLGINADTQDDLRHFADVSVKQEHDKLERELRFNSAFHEAASRLYSSEQIIKPFDIRPFTPIPKG